MHPRCTRSARLVTAGDVNAHNGRFHEIDSAEREIVAAAETEATFAQNTRGEIRVLRVYGRVENRGDSRFCDSVFEFIDTASFARPFCIELSICKRRLSISRVRYFILKRLRGEDS